MRVTEGDEQRARDIIAQYSDKKFSYTDATSFAVMERLQIDMAFPLDRNFAQFGFIVLPSLCM
ncbi:MAG: type II toxin-antitoxin system VapC family toxin, partial [Dehalococcoidia bacterium]